VVNVSRHFGLYTSLIFSSYTSYLLNVSSSLTSFTAPSRRFKIEVSGWYAEEGLRRRAAEEGVYGIPLSDHSDFPSLVEFVRETSPRLVYAAYGFSERLTRHLRRLGFKAYAIPGATGLAKFF
jgi:putative mRNA 3-end processing factor